MSLVFLKKCKLPVMVICMLAAGICYSCSGCDAPDSRKDGAMVLEEEGALSEQPEEENVMDDHGGGYEANAGIEESSRISEAAGGITVTGIFVHVCGRVHKPGVYELPEGSRVHEAIRAAGGSAEDGAADYLNLAQELQDGMKLEVPSISEAALWKAQGTGPLEVRQGDPDDHAKLKVNLNRASKEELMGLRGIGESRAEDIIRYRDRFGGFKTIEDIMNVSGIKDAAFEKIKDDITV